MPKVRVHALSMSLDGFVAGPDQGPDSPLGRGGEKLHGWSFKTRHARQMHGMSGDGLEGISNDFMIAGDENIGATIMGRNMFGPVRGDWRSDDWKGWWGDDPPYGHDVFVLTHHPRTDVPMKGGTTFHFVTEGIEAALDLAFEAAKGKDVRIGGGASTVQQYLRAGLIDYMHVAITPKLLGAGERLFEDLGEALKSYDCKEFVGDQDVAHAVLTKR
jgi:dihydrofolate reductase